MKSATGKEAGGTTNRLQEQFGYAYDAAGNLNRRTNNALVQTFNVNTLNELTTITNKGTLTVAGTTTSAATNVTVNTPNAVLYADATFAKDHFTIANGNNTFTAIAKDSYGRMDTNSVTVNLPTTNAFAYDLNGNTLTNGTRTFDYDDENQLVRITEPAVWKSEFAYDGKMRRRIRKEFTWQSSAWVQTNEVHYVYDGNLVIQERDANNLPQVTYTRGNDLSGTLQGAGGIGGLLARTENSSPAFIAWVIIQGGGGPMPHYTGSAYYHADGNGNVTALIDGNQSIVAKYLYDPYGNILSQSGPLADANLYRFSSKEYHPNSGLVYYLYRLYDSRLQRWQNRDPFGDYGFQELSAANALQRTDGNLYVFVDNSPLAKIDAWGLEPTFKGCRQKQIDATKQALKDECKKAKDCAKPCPTDGKASAGVSAVCDGNPTFNCVGNDFQFADGNNCKSRCGEARGGEIFLCDNTFNSSKGCGRSVACTVFHEALHVGGLPGNSTTPHPSDFQQFQKCMNCSGPDPNPPVKGKK